MVLVFAMYIYIYFESCLFGLFSMFVASSFGASVLNFLPISFVAGAGDPHVVDGAVRNISSAIWRLSSVRRDFCSALLMVCMFRSTNPFDLGYLGLEVICLKSHSFVFIRSKLGSITTYYFSRDSIT